MNPNPICESFAVELSNFVLGELDVDRCVALESHLVQCESCRDEHARLARTVELLQQESGASAGVLKLSDARREALLASAASGRPSAANVSTSRVGVRALLAASLVAGTLGLVWISLKQGAPARGSEVAATNEDEFRFTSRQGTGRILYAPDRDRGDGATPAVGGASSSIAPESSSWGHPPETFTTTDSDTLERLRTLGYISELSDDDLSEALPSLHGAGDTVPPSAALSQPSTADPAALSTLPQGVAGGTSIGVGDAGHRGRGVSAFSSRRVAVDSKNAGPEPATPAPGRMPTHPLGAGGRGRGELGKQTSDAAGSASFAPGLDSVDSFAFVESTDPAAAANPAQLGIQLAFATTPSDLNQLEAALRARAAVIGTIVPTDPAAPAASAVPEIPATGRGVDVDGVIREFLERLAPRQGETPRDMFFRYFGDHPFVSTRVDPLSTFGMDVDTASYSLVRAYLTRGVLPPKAAVRTEEFVNAFQQELAPPDVETRDVFAIHTDVAPSPFGPDGSLLLRVGLKAREVSRAQRKPLALTLVIDVSGSMAEGGRLELVKQSIRLLLDQLDERDTIGIVAFESTGRRVLAPTNASIRWRIEQAIAPLEPGGSTNVDQGLRLGYEMALEQWRERGENRVVLFSDGVANTGITDPNALLARIRECKSRHVGLNCVGVGFNNLNDALLEQLADEGDGNCAYVDRLDEARKLFVDKLTSSLQTVARAAKIQVEFRPETVRRFRQLGYENRALAHRDFRNDRVDAGEVGAGHEIVALYEIEPAKRDADEPRHPLATVRVRYQDPDRDEVREQSRDVVTSDELASFARAPVRFRLDAVVAEFAELLRQSVHARDGSLGQVLALARPVATELPDDKDVAEFVALVEQAARLPDLLPARSDLARCVDEIKKARCWRRELEDVKDPANDDLLRQLEEQNRRLEQALRDALDRRCR